MSATHLLLYYFQNALRFMVSVVYSKFVPDRNSFNLEQESFRSGVSPEVVIIVIESGIKRLKRDAARKSTAYRLKSQGFAPEQVSWLHRQWRRVKCLKFLNNIVVSTHKMHFTILKTYTWQINIWLDSLYKFIY